MLYIAAILLASCNGNSLSGRYWEDAITNCATGSTSSNALPATGWRLPTQKEMLQVYIDGIAAKRVELNMVNAFLWSSTTQSDNASYGGHVLHLNNGDGGLSGKPDHGFGSLCIYP